MKFSEHGWIAGTIGHKNPVEFFAGSDEIIIPWDSDNCHVTIEKIAKNIIFHTAIYADDAFFAFFVGAWFFDGNLINKIIEIGIIEGYICDFFRYDFTENSSGFANFLSEGASIDAGDGRNIVFFKPGTERFFCVPVTVVFRIFAYY